ncbi:MAG TPA: hypothetical protein VGF68_07950, partial [Solirubrobacteraceae bacterium]
MSDALAVLGHARFVAGADEARELRVSGRVIGELGTDLRELRLVYVPELAEGVLISIVEVRRSGAPPVDRHSHTASCLVVAVQVPRGVAMTS